MSTCNVKRKREEEKKCSIKKREKKASNNAQWNLGPLKKKKG